MNFKQRRRCFRLEHLESRAMLHGDGPHDPGQLGPFPDVTGDGLVTDADLALVSQNSGLHTPLGDATGDGMVNDLDLHTVTDALGLTPHMDSAEKLKEHLDLLSLVLPETADIMAVKSGAWSDPLVWNTGKLPASGERVWIPPWYALEVDGEFSDPLAWLRVDGTLSFSDHHDSQLLVDTIIGTPTSHLEIHTSDPNVSTRIVVADTGPIDTEWDRFAITRGVVWHGASHIRGAEKATWTTAEPVSAGATELEVADSTGWRVGDRLVLGSSSVGRVGNRWANLPEDDDVRIAAIDGTIVTLDRALQYNHSRIETQNPIIINMSRNVSIESQNTALDRRGHAMFMHNADQRIEYAGFYDLGRTDKSVLVSDPDGEGNGFENVRGRYPLHIHRAGTDAAPVVVTGIAISGSPGWGLVNHDSNVVADHSVSYDVFGAHFVTELGNERGSFTNNVAVRSIGTGEKIENLTRQRRALNDVGHTGDGFWLEGGDVLVEKNVSIGMGSSGFVFFTPDRDSPIAFRGNVALQSSRSLFIWVTRFPMNQFPLIPPEGTQFSEVSNNLLQGSVTMGYSSCIEFTGNVVVPYDTRLSRVGIAHNGVNANIRYIDNLVTGFETGILMPSEGFNIVQGGYFDNSVTNFLIASGREGRIRQINYENVDFGNQAELNINMSLSNFSYDLAGAFPGSTRRVPDWQPLFATNNAVFGLNSQVFVDGIPLYFEEQSAGYEFGATLTRFPEEIRYEPDGETLTTGKSLNEMGMYVGGRPLPPGEQYYVEKVRGVFVAPEFDVDAGGPYSGFAETPVVLAASHYFPSDGSTPTYNWDFDGDGAFDDATGSRVTYIPTGAGETEVRVRLTDSTGSYVTDSATVTAHLNGDLNSDDVIDRTDAVILASHFGRTTSAFAQDGDFDGDGKVGLRDLAVLQSRFTPANSAPSALARVAADVVFSQDEAIAAAESSRDRSSARVARPKGPRRGQIRL